MTGLAIAMLAHSTNPRGGVVHALELCDALAALGHRPELFAPDVSGEGFYRPAACRLHPLPVTKAPPGIAAMVHQRVADYRAHFTPAECTRFDVFHAQDSISANALAALHEAGRIGGFLRTVHHVDDFTDPELMRLQAHGIVAASALFTVSHYAQHDVMRRFGRESIRVGNGVNLATFSPQPDTRDAATRARLGLGGGPVILSLGGVEPRKNSLRILEAFRMLRDDSPDAVLLIAGGATLLDHSQYQDDFAAALASTGLPPGAVQLLGRLPYAEMPALYRLADTMVFPSLREGFGLAVLEAMASAVPVVVPRAAPFTEYLGSADAAWCDPMDPGSILQAMRQALGAGRHELRRRGPAVARNWCWQAVARAHLPAYENMRSLHHA